MTTRRTLLQAATAATYFGTFLNADADPIPETQSPVRFREHLIDHFPGAYQCSVADLNSDGKLDIIAVSSGKSEIAWYENPTWKKHIITTATHSNMDAVAYDLDGDGKLEIAVASEFDLGNSRIGGRLQWFKAGATPDAEWIGHDFAALPTAHRLRWVDWDGNGKKELVVVPILGHGATAPAYTVPTPIVSYGFVNGVAQPHPVDTSLTVAHGMRILDFDNDSRDDLLVASFEGVTWYKPVGKGPNRTWRKIPLAAGEQSEQPPRRGSSEVDRGWLKGKRPFLATIEPWHGNEVVVYTPPADPKALDPPRH